MSTIYLVIILIQALIFGGFSAFVAKEKNRNTLDWFLLGFFFSFIALVSLIAVPKVEKPILKDSKKNKTSNVINESNIEEKILSPIKILYLLFALILITGLILYSAGVFDSTTTPIQTENKSFEDQHSGVDLQNLERINELENQYKINPNNQVLLELAHLLNDSGFKERAIEKYKIYLTTNPKDADVLVDMGVCYYELQNYTEAERWMKEALKYNPKHQIAHMNLGIVTINSGKHDEAIEWWKKAIEINPNTDIAKRAQELINSH